MTYATVAPDQRLPRSLDGFIYAVPSALKKMLTIGARVRIPLRSHIASGTIIAFHTKKPSSLKRPPKHILDLADPHAWITPMQMTMARWLAETTSSSLSTALKLFRPSESVITSPRSRKTTTSFQWFQTMDERYAAIRSLHTDAKKRKRTVLLLEPEYADLDDVAAHVDDITILDGRKTSVQLKKSFQKCARVHGCIMTTRIGLFFSWKRLHTIIVDDDASDRHVHWDQNPRYDARTLADVAAQAYRSDRLSFGSLPSPATVLGKDGAVPVQVKSPHPVVVDLLAEARNGTPYPFSDALLSSIDDCLSSGKRVVLLHNRRGESTIVRCAECSTVQTCQTCGRSLTHMSDGAMQCMGCRTTEAAYACASCGSTEMKYAGVGIGKITSKLRTLFPGASIDTIDRTTPIEKMLEANITVGTSAIAKRWDPETTGLLAVMSVESYLPQVDLLQPLRLFATLESLRFRLGTNGRMIVQTTHPDDPVMQALATGQYRKWYSTLLTERKDAGFPPYGTVLRIQARYPSERDAERHATQLVHMLSSVRTSAVDVGDPVVRRSPGRSRGWDVSLVLVVHLSVPSRLNEALRDLPNDWIVDPAPLTLSPS